MKLTVTATLMKSLLYKKSENTHVFGTPSVGLTKVVAKNRMLDHSCVDCLINVGVNIYNNRTV